MTLLGRPLSIEPPAGGGKVDDVEALARAKLDEFLRRTGGELERGDYDEALSFLISTIFELSLRYAPEKDRARAKGRQPTFSDYAAQILKFRIVDWYRQRFGDTRYGTRPHEISLDAAQAEAAGREDRLEQALARGQADPQSDRCPDLARALQGRGGEEPWPLEALGHPEDGRPPRRARGATAVKPAKVPPTRRPTEPVPHCDDCADFLTRHLEERGYTLPQARRLAREKTKKVLFRGQRLCRFCDTVEIKAGKLVPLFTVLPNRAARRAAERAKPEPESDSDSESGGAGEETKAAAA